MSLTLTVLIFNSVDKEVTICGINSLPSTRLLSPMKPGAIFVNYTPSVPFIFLIQESTFLYEVFFCCCYL